MESGPARPAMCFQVQARASEDLIHSNSSEEPGTLGARTMFREFGRVEFYVQASLHITPREIGVIGFDGTRVCNRVAVQWPVIGFRNRIHEGRLLFNAAVG